VAQVLSVNLARVRTNPDPKGQEPTTGIHKVATRDAVAVRGPGPMHGGVGSGLVGDTIGNQRVHGGDDQAVYAYAREDLDTWAAQLDRSLENGMFGENLTTLGVEVTDARVGERWRIGDRGLVLEVTSPRIPCTTFSSFLEIRGWIKTFTQAAVPGAYLRVISSGTVSADDTISVEHRPDHDVTVGLVFRALMTEPDLLPRLLEADALPDDIKQNVRQRVSE
jgi:MOSC domain-containing protein YiiM